MSQPMNIDVLRGACMAHGISIEASSYNELRIALGGVLVDKMLGISTSSPPGPPMTSTPAPVTTSKPDEPKKAKGKRPSDTSTSQEKKPRRKSKYHAFLQSETPLIRSGMPQLKGHEVLREAVRRWRIVKSNESNSSGSPPMLTCTDGASSDDNSSESAETLTNALMELPPAEVNLGLQAAGLAVEPGNPVGNASRLAFQMLDID